jgi:thiamine biosynthesis lipoprotein
MSSGDARDTHEYSFAVMGSEAHVIVVGAPESVLDDARARLDDLEARWSRFRPDSEVSRLNACAGEWMDVGDETFALLERAQLAHERTAGRFDPFRLHDVVRAGYGTAPGVPLPATELPDPAVDGIGHVELDDVRRAARLPPGVGFDPGGLGKGFAADLVAEQLVAAGAHGACVNVGGDLRVIGSGPGDGPWVVAIDDPRTDGATVGALHLSDGAVATSSRCRRRWTDADGREAHHLIDPATGAPARTEVLAATVVAAEAWQAESLSKVAFLAPADQLDELLAAAGADGLVVRTDGVTTTSGWSRFLGPAGPTG